MGRRRTIPDDEIFAAIRRMLAEGGDKAVSFQTVSRAVGLVPSTLAQRYASRDGMVQAALLSAWDAYDLRTAEAEAAAPLSEKGAVQFLKALSDEDEAPVDLALLAVDFRDPVLRARAAAWRARVELALTVRLGGGAKGREAAGILFLAWQGQAVWRAAGGRAFRLKDAVRRLT